MTTPVRPIRLTEVTAVPADRESDFRKWIHTNRVTDLDHARSHYDYRGAFMAGISRDSETGHWPDTFKQHGHPTFSVESKYATHNDPSAGRWSGDIYLSPTDPYYLGPLPRGTHYMPKRSSQPIASRYMVSHPRGYVEPSDTFDEHVAVFEALRAASVNGVAERALPDATRVERRGYFKPTIRQTLEDVGRQTLSGLAHAGIETAAGPLSALAMLAQAPDMTGGVLETGQLGARLLMSTEMARAYQGMADQVRNDTYSYYGKPMTNAGAMARVSSEVAGTLALLGIPKVMNSSTMRALRADAAEPLVGGPTVAEDLAGVKASRLQAGQRRFLSDLAGSDIPRNLDLPIGGKRVPGPPPGNPRLRNTGTAFPRDVGKRGPNDFSALDKMSHKGLSGYLDRLIDANVPGEGGLLPGATENFESLTGLGLPPINPSARPVLDEDAVKALLESLREPPNMIHQALYRPKRIPSKYLR